MINWVAWWYSPGRDLSTDELCESIAEMAVASVRPTAAAPPGRTPHEVISSIRAELVTWSGSSPATGLAAVRPEPSRTIAPRVANGAREA